MFLLCWSHSFHECRSWRRPSRSHSFRSSRKSVETIRVETTAVEVEKIRSEFFEAERALVASPFSKVKSLISDRTLKLGLARIHS